MTTIPEQCSILASRRALIMHKAKRTPRQTSFLPSFSRPRSIIRQLRKTGRGIDLINFLQGEEGQCSRTFARLLRFFDHLSSHLREAEKRMRIFWSVWISWQRKVWTQRHLRGVDLKCRFLARENANSSPNFALRRCRHFGPSLSFSLTGQPPPPPPPALYQALLRLV